MSKVPAKVRERILAQGFCGLDDALTTQINYPLRLAPAICMCWTAVGTALASATVLWALVPFALLGAVLPGHPFDVIYNFGLRHLFDMPALPRYGVRRRLACVVAAVVLSAAAFAFQSGVPMLGYAMGGSLIALASINVITGFCVPSFILRILFGKVICERPAESGVAR